jgi:hypothetical protein
VLEKRLVIVQLSLEILANFSRCLGGPFRIVTNAIAVDLQVDFRLSAFANTGKAEPVSMNSDAGDHNQN